MAGDPTKAALWSGADVYVNETVGDDGPEDLTTAWAAEWENAGLLDGEEGFEEERDEDSEEYYAWGGILVKKTKSKHKRTIKFVCLEDNLVTFGLVNPGSTRTTATGVTTSVVKVPTGREFAIGFEVRDGKKRKRRIVKRAEVDTVDAVKEAETELTVYTITVVIYPEADGTLYTELSGTIA
ncbi:hypothetical protein ACPXB5_11305 [Micromonospora arida]|uniref:phage tail tube protein n=1 Tax=Micromonospora arida TaxID=2203715 RepID=UPI003CFBBC7B